MPNNWKKYKLIDILNLIGGGTPKTKVKEYWDGDIPWLSVVDFNNGQKRVYITEKTITGFGLKNSSTKMLKKGQLIISARGTVGVLAELGRDMSFNQSCYGLDAIEGLTTNNFLYYLVGYNINQIKSKAYGSVFDTITRSTFENIDIVLPPLPEQHAIAEILSALDDKIELNLQTNKTLEEMANALYKEWFVDFGPFKKGKFVKSELDMIPEGWEVKKINTLFNLTIGRTPPRKEKEWFTTNYNDMKWISIRDMGIADTYIYSTSEYLTNEAIIKHNIPKIPANTVVLSFKLTVGRITITTEEMLSNEAIAHFI